MPLRLKIPVQTIILSFIVLMFLADGANSILLNTGIGFYKVSIYVRLVAQCCFLLLLVRKREGIKVWGLMAFFWAVFIMGSIAAIIELYTVQEYPFFEQFRIINKVIFYFIVFELIRLYFTDPVQHNRLFKIYEALIVAQSLVIVVSFIFDIKIFSAYLLDIESGRIRRFGYQGLIPAQNEISGFFFIAFFYYLAKVHHTHRGVPGLLLITVAGLLTGTKANLILPVILACYWLTSRAGSIATHTLRIYKRFLMIGAALLFGILAIALNWDSVLARIEPTISYYSYQIGEQSGSALNTLLAVGRRTKATTMFETHLPQFNLLNYLFGGFPLTIFATEMDPLDMFVLLGIIGGAVFYVLYVRSLLLTKNATMLRWLFITMWLGISLIAGHITYTAINATYLSIFLLSLTSLEENNLVRRGEQVYRELSS